MQNRMEITVQTVPEEGRFTRVQKAHRGLPRPRTESRVVPPGVGVSECASCWVPEPSRRPAETNDKFNPRAPVCGLQLVTEPGDPLPWQR